MMKITSTPAGSDTLMKEPAYVALTILAFISTLLLLAYHLWLTHGQSLDAAATNSSNIAWVLEERLDTTLRRVDSDLIQIATQVTSTKPPQATKPRDLAAWTGYLAGFKRNFPEINGYYVFDAYGQLVANSEPQVKSLNITDRYHFQHLRDTPNAGLVFSDVLMSRTTGRPMIVVARGMRDQKGKFIGIVSATVDLDYLQKLFNSIQIGERGAISLIRSDNLKLVLRHPPRPSDYNKQIRTKQVPHVLAGERIGIERYTSHLDKVARIGSFRALTDYPFYVNVAIAETDALAQWRSIALGSIVGTAIFLAGLIFLQIRLWRTEGLRRNMILKLDRAAQIDELTHLPNRRNFMTRAEDELSRTLRHGGSLSVLMMDIDNFKAINDTYGHKTGDVVLRELAELCQQSLRVYDIVGRLGGEEFAFLFPNTEVTLGVEIAERMRESIEHAMVKTEDGQFIQFTVSIGVSALANDNASIESLLSQSDKAMYEAKHAGRNRVCVYGSQIQESLSAVDR